MIASTIENRTKMSSKEMTTNRMRTFSGSNMLRYRTYLMPPSNPFREGKSKLQFMRQAATIILILSLVVMVLLRFVQHDQGVQAANSVMKKSLPKEVDTPLLQGEKNIEQLAEISANSPVIQHDEGIKQAENLHVDSSLQESKESSHKFQEEAKQESQHLNKEQDSIESSNASNTDENNAQHEHNNVAVPG